MSLKIWSLIGTAAVGFVLLFVYLGIFNVAADVPHSALVSTLMQLVRDRSIAARIKDVQVPPLDDSKLIADGGEHYAAMCVDCHLAPGVKPSEMRQGLYPQPPDLTEQSDAGPAAKFWTIKHGIKMSAMPAWGKTHDDRSIWGLVAFLEKLPALTPDEYRALVGADREDDRDDHPDAEVGERAGEDTHDNRRGDADPHRHQPR